jgi:plastocyanin
MAPVAGRLWPALTVGAVLILALAACSSGPISDGSPTPSSSSAAASMSMASVASTAPTATTVPSPSQAGAARCSVTADASPSATVTIASFSFGDPVTITAGQAVAFINQDGVAHTITEGTDGTAASDACVDKSVGAGGTVIVTFNQPGDYQITCKFHSTMQTVVHIQ